MMLKITVVWRALQRRLVVLSLGATAVGLVFITQNALAQTSTMGGQQEAESVSWAPLTTQPPFNTDTAHLLTDGTVIVHQYNSNLWWRLTPDINGSYLNGSWTQLGGMQTNFKPLYFASAVLP